VEVVFELARVLAVFVEVDVEVETTVVVTVGGVY
jgi:hypothetical protein